MSSRWMRALTVSMLVLWAGGTWAATSGSDPLAVLGPLDSLVDFFTGGFGLKLVILALVAVGAVWWKSREDMGEKLTTVVKWAVGAALILGAPDIVTALGFASATV